MAKLVAFDRGQVELKAGTTLSREWNGITQRAIVVDDGFLWEETRYDSLSAIAFAITDTWTAPMRWSDFSLNVFGDRENATLAVFQPDLLGKHHVPDRQLTRRSKTQP